MGQNFTVHIDLAGHHIPDTSWTWGTIASGETRRSAPSYGTHVEVPAVIQLLQLVVSGDVSAEQARDCLNDIATSINQQMDRQYSRYLSFDEESEGSQASALPPAAPERPALDSRWVYAVSSEADPKAIKIGVARDIEKRLRSLQVGSASVIVLRWSERGGYALERYLHETFRKRRINGEWFDFRRVADPAKKIAEAARAFLDQFESDRPDAA